MGGQLGQQGELRKMLGLDLIVLISSDHESLEKLAVTFPNAHPRSITRLSSSYLILLILALP